MPELPEVETIAHRLRQVVCDQQIQTITPLHDKSFQGNPLAVVSTQITDVRRKGKQLRLQLDNGHSLAIHLKMTGQLIYVDNEHRFGGGHPTADWVQDLPSRHTRVIIEFAKGGKLFFNDQRLFGWIKLISDAELDAQWQSLPPDINEANATAEYLQNRLGKRGIPIKVGLLDSSIVGGLGNIYVCDALNEAQIHPERPAKSLSSAEWQRVTAAAKRVIEQGIELGGTTFDGKYVDVAGFAGGYQTVARVYDRKGEACLQCGGLIVKTKLAGRGTYYCEQCQR